MLNRIFLFVVLLATISPIRVQSEGVLPPMPAGAFTVVVIPDTQHYLGPETKLTTQGKPMLEAVAAHPYVQSHLEVSASQPLDAITNVYLKNHVRWIVENQASQNIVFASHVGDIVEINRPEEWGVANDLLAPLRGVVPFGLTVGNHDMEGDGDATYFQDTFPKSSFEAESWYLGAYAHDRPDQNVSANNVNSAQLFSAGGVDCLFLHLECNAPDDVLAWANQVLSDHSDRLAMITTHMDLGVIDRPTTQDGYIHDPQGRMRWVKIHGKRGNTGEQMWDKLYRKHANLGFVFSGDQSRVTALRETRMGDSGQPVHALLSDYMSLGALRLIRFIPSENRVQVITYDSTLNRRVDSMPYAPERERHQFSIPFDRWPRTQR